jgi:hypothetical protein
MTATGRDNDEREPKINPDLCNSRPAEDDCI